MSYRSKMILTELPKLVLMKLACILSPRRMLHACIMLVLRACPHCAMAVHAGVLVVRLLLLSSATAVSSARGKHGSYEAEELLDPNTIPGLSYSGPRIENAPGVHLWWPQYLQSPLAPRTDLAAIEDQLAIAYIAIGKDVTHEMLLPLSISTVRRAGGFRGDVFVITDRPD
eukprot:6190955-Pleurochrysis_carterae.AAC.1